MRCKAVSRNLLGPAVVALENLDDGLGRHVAEITIPDADLPDIVGRLLARCYQQNLWSETLNLALDTAIEVRKHREGE